MNRVLRHIVPMRSLAFGKRVTTALQVGAASILLLTSACGMTSEAERQAKPPGDIARMFSAVLENVREIYIEEQPVNALALAGLERIRVLDPAASIERQNGDIRLLINGTTVAAAPTASVNDYETWGAVMERLIEDGTDVSQRLQSTSREDLFKTLIDGQLSGLDRYSRYAGAEAAQRQREDREGFGGIGISIVGDADGARIEHVADDMPAARGGCPPHRRDTVSGTRHPGYGILRTPRADRLSAHDRLQSGHNT